jgi:hypothetical protein
VLTKAEDLVRAVAEAEPGVVPAITVGEGLLRVGQGAPGAALRLAASWSEASP